MSEETQQPEKSLEEAVEERKDIFHELGIELPPLPKKGDLKLKGEGEEELPEAAGLRPLTIEELRKKFPPKKPANPKFEVLKHEGYSILRIKTTYWKEVDFVIYDSMKLGMHPVFGRSESGEFVVAGYSDDVTGSFMVTVGQEGKYMHGGASYEEDMMRGDYVIRDLKEVFEEQKYDDEIKTLANITLDPEKVFIR